ncbi:VanZ family protein [Pseudonocardiaceae bacterium YIM PH 21723]|nr:VanZ family protein [Pseudonocardiaceae bacterium YIM PH 21723]
MTNAQLASIQWGLFLSVLFLVPQYLLRLLTWRSCMVTGYVSMLFAAVFLPWQSTPPRQALQLVPFQWVADTLRDGEIAFHQMTLNILLFVPLGAMLLFWGRRSFAQAALLGFGISLGIETVQLLWANRIFDVDDLITNTVGTAVGWALVLSVLGLRARVVAGLPAEERVMAGVR